MAFALHRHFSRKHLVLLSDHRGVDSSTLATDTVPKGPGTPGPSLFSSDGGD